MTAEEFVLPFTLEKVHLGFSDATGLLRVSRESLVFEYEVKALGLVKVSGVATVRAAMEEIESVELKKGFFRTDLTVRAKSLKTFHSLPGSLKGEAPLRIENRDRKQAELIVSNINLYLSELKLKRFDDTP